MTTIKTKHMTEREWDLHWVNHGILVYLDGCEQTLLRRINHERELPPISDDFPAEVHAAATWEIRANRPLAPSEWRDPETRELYEFEVDEDGQKVRTVADGHEFLSVGDLCFVELGMHAPNKRRRLAMRDYLRTHGRPSYIPEGSHWGWVTDGLGRRVGAWVNEVCGEVRIHSAGSTYWVLVWRPDGGDDFPDEICTPGLSEQCQALWDSRPQEQPRQSAARAELLEQLQNVKAATDAAPAHARENYEQAKRAEERLGYLPQEKRDEPPWLTIGEHGQPPEGSRVEWRNRRENTSGLIEHYTGKADPPKGQVGLGYADTEYRILRSGPALKAVEFDSLVETTPANGKPRIRILEYVDLPPGTPVHVVVTPLEAKFCGKVT